MAAVEILEKMIYKGGVAVCGGAGGSRGGGCVIGGFVLGLQRSGAGEYRHREHDL
jgi:hypothetical protein